MTRHRHHGSGSGALRKRYGRAADVTRRLVFYECEHDGDLGGYVADLGRAGATVVSQRLLSSETCEVVIRVSDWPSFVRRFKETPSADFTDGVVA